jgi:hypothetical protein
MISINKRIICSIRRNKRDKKVSTPTAGAFTIWKCANVAGGSGKQEILNAVGIGVVRARYCNGTDCSIDFIIAFHGHNSRDEFRASRMPDRTIHKPLLGAR